MAAKVVVRVRPLNEREMEMNTRIVVDVVDDKMLVFDPKKEIRPYSYRGVQQPSKNFLKRGNKELKFVFDNVCGHKATNQDVFETTTKDALAFLMEGYNCSVFAYGATGAGKTFTMIGSKEHPGITYLTMEHLFYIIHAFEKEREFDIRASYTEVYNENVYDLLKPSSTPLQLQEDSKHGVTVVGLTLYNINTARELLNMLENGSKNRKQHPTDAIAESSRSHAVFQVYVRMRDRTSSQLRTVKLSMIDLAGSEGASATGCVGERFKEGANINKSLLALGCCMHRLADGSSYIPYRDSKLTRLLKDSLGGNCKTVMIANVSPASVSYEDTYNTLKYAARANKIQLNIKKNIVDGDTRQYVKITEELKKKVKELEAKLSLSSLKVSREPDLAKEYVKITEELKKKVKELEAKLSLSSLKVSREPDLAKEKVKQEWRKRISEEEEIYSRLETTLLSLMSRQYLLATRLERAFPHVADLAHRSFSEAVEQIHTEEIPRQECAAENCMKQSVHLDSKVMTTWTKWVENKKKLHIICEQALSDCQELTDFVDKVQLNSELRQIKASYNLIQKLYSDEIEANTEYMSDIPPILKKNYFLLKEYDKAPPSLTTEYLEIIKKAKLVKGIEDDGNEGESHFNEGDSHFDEGVSHFDEGDSHFNEGDSHFIEGDSHFNEGDCHFKDILNLDLHKPSTSLEYSVSKKDDVKATVNSYDIAADVENHGVIDPKDLGKMEAALKQPLEHVPVKRVLRDMTNTIATRTINFGDKGTAKIVKPVVGIPSRRQLNPTQTRSFGFGSSVPRDQTQCNVQDATGDDVTEHGARRDGYGTTLGATSHPGAGRRARPSQSAVGSGVSEQKGQRSVGYKYIKARYRSQWHPYSRPLPAASTRKMTTVETVLSTEE